MAFLMASCRPPRMSVIIGVIAFIFLLPIVYVGQTALSGNKRNYESSSGGGRGGGVLMSAFGVVQPDPPGILPPDLMGSVYTLGDFNNSSQDNSSSSSMVTAVAPTFWNCSSDGNCDSNEIWGPCYAPHGKIHWKREAEKHESENQAIIDAAKSSESSSSSSSYMPPRHYYNHDEAHTSGWNTHPDPNDVANTCRPGFLIIGAGKCGTSSLYHYITSHPRVLPARNKQIHYFKYFYMRHPLKWYLSYFPNAVSFLASGALMTGEASPGYLPYPDVPNRIRETMPGPRIVVVGRNPIERAYSSYKYNYVSPNIEAMKRGRVKGIAGEKGTNHTDSYYEQHVFSFEDMMRAELNELRECLDPANGAAIVQARKTWGAQQWAAPEYIRRSEEGLPPLADLDGFCYGDDKVKNSTAPRRQWKELMAQQPEKVIVDKDLHLVQALLGRSIYALPLEWWYAVFDAKDIYFMCTEELRDLSGKPLDSLGSFLGLPTFNFSTAVSEGAFNVAGHRGYNKEVSWEDIERESQTPNASTDDENVEEEQEQQQTIPLSDDLRKELENFLRPYNERLFALTGKRCNW